MILVAFDKGLVKMNRSNKTASGRPVIAGSMAESVRFARVIGRTKVREEVA